MSDCPTEPLDDLPRSASAGSAVLASGSWLGRYRIQGLIGRGGMGLVYRAEQHEPVRRSVAIKQALIDAMGAEDRLRFNLERQVLAAMRHPNIAQLLDAGATPDGAPWFAMELVEGQRLSDYATRRGLSAEQRLQLFLACCAGVEHAHRRGIVHCDLKPSNLMVSDVDGAPQVKVIDFGIARALGGPGGKPDSAGTPGYMSPEQADGVTDLDPRTDVYSLGVVLHELLSGITATAQDEAEPRPARRPLPRTPGTPVAALTTLRCAELEAIINRATQADRESRYDDVASLVADIQRWLAHRPVLAFSASTGYRLRCALRRHRTLAAVCLLSTLLIGALLLQLVQQYGELRRQRDAAEHSLALLLDLFRRADPYAHPGGSISVRQLLQESGGRIDRPQVPAEVRLRLLRSLAEVQANLELHDDAIASLLAAEAVAGQAGPEAATLIGLQLDRVLQEIFRGGWKEADGLLTAIESSLDGHEDASLRLRTALLRVDWLLYQDRYAEAAALLQRSEPELAAVNDPTLRYQWLRLSGRKAMEQGQHAEALPWLEQALREARQQWPDHDAQVMGLLTELAMARSRAGLHDEAIERYREIAAITEATFGGDSVSLGVDLDNLGVALRRRGGAGDLDEALALHARAERLFLDRLGEHSSYSATAASNLASALEESGAFERAAEHFALAEARMRAALGERHSLVGIVRHNRARALLASGRAAQALPLQSSAGELLLETLGAEHPRYAIWQVSQGLTLLELGDWEDALALAETAAPRLREAYGADSREFQRAESLLAATRARLRGADR